MICPYCSVEMEPIDLAGKIFCSNCGMTLKVSPNVPAEPLPKITIGSPRTEPPADLPPEVPEPPKPEKPFEPTISSLVEEEPKTDEPPQAPKSGPDVIASAMETLKADLGEEIAASAMGQEVNEIKNEPEPKVSSPEVGKPVENKQEGILLDILGNSSTVPEEKPAVSATPEPVIRTLSPAEEPTKTDLLSNKIKEIDTLGTSGILLDILSDGPGAKSEETKSALEAADQLVEMVKPSEIKQPVPSEVKHEDFIPKPPVPGQTLKTVTASEDNDPVASVQQDASVNVNQEKPQKEPDEHVVIQAQALKPKNAKKLKVHTPLDDMPNPIQTPEIVAELDLPTIEETRREDLIAEAAREIHETPAKEKIIKAEEAVPVVSPPNPIPSAGNSSQLKDYFTEIMTTKDKKKGKKKKKSRSAFWPVFGIIFFCVILIVGLAGTYIYFIDKDSNTKEAVEETVEKPMNKSDEVSLPKEIPFGYELTTAPTKTEGSERYTAVYSFKGDGNRTLTFSSEKIDQNAGTLITSFKSSHTGAYSANVIDSITYTEYDNGDIAWIKNGYFYTITVKGETYKEQIINMAKSVE